jgi:hypothetical protein
MSRRLKPGFEALAALCSAAVLAACGAPSDDLRMGSPPSPTFQTIPAPTYDPGEGGRRLPSVGLTVEEIIDPTTAVGCMTIDAYENLDESGRRAIPPPNRLEPRPREVTLADANQAIDISSRHLESHGLQVGVESIVFIEPFTALQRSVTVHFVFTDPVELPHDLGLPPGDQPGDELRVFSEDDVRKTRPVESEADRDLFRSAGAADIVVDLERAEPVWIMPLEDALWCRFGG